MKLTKHVKKRMKQRGFMLPDIISVIENSINPILKPDGAIEYSVNNKMLAEMESQFKWQLQYIERLRNKSVVAVGDIIITCYPKNKKKKRKRKFHR